MRVLIELMTLREWFSDWWGRAPRLSAQMARDEKEGSEVASRRICGWFMAAAQRHKATSPTSSEENDELETWPTRELQSSECSSPLRPNLSASSFRVSNETCPEFTPSGDLLTSPGEACVGEVETAWGEKEKALLRPGEAPAPAHLRRRAALGCDKGWRSCRCWWNCCLCL